MGNDDDVLDVAEVHETAMFVVRCYDNYWFDVTGPVPFAEARTEWNRCAENGTKFTKYAHGSYFAIFPAGTRMLFSAPDRDPSEDRECEFDANV